MMAGAWTSRLVGALALLTLVGCNHAEAAERHPSSGEKTVRIERTAEPPVIDGLLDEPAWATAAVIEDVHQITPTEHSEPSESTIFYLLADENAIYVAARMFDRTPDRISAKMLKQGDSLRWDDHLMVNLHPFNDGRSGYRFEVNPNGVRFDGIYRNANRILWDWDGIWSAAAVRNADGWTAEVAIPFKTLSFDPSVDAWGLNVSRNMGGRNERVGWVSRNRAQDPTAAGILTGMAGADPGICLDVVPSASLRRSHAYDGEEARIRLEPSLDVFYKLTPRLNASLTLNTDFSATEVDDRQVNLTRFAAFFPEKRDFFLKDADSFDFGRIGVLQMASTLPAAAFENGRPFFSRRIGLSRTGQPIDLAYGAKLSGRIGTAQLGALAIRQDAYDDVEAKDLLVARAVVNAGKRSTIGMIFTHGDPRPNRDNRVLGVDMSYLHAQLPGGRVLEGEAWYQRSEADGSSADGDAWGLRLHAPNSTGLRGGVGLKTLEPGFDPALGFVSRRGVRDIILEIGHTWRRSAGRFRSFYIGIDGERVEHLGGGLQSQIIVFRALELESRRGDLFTVRYAANEEVLHEPFEIFPGITLPPGAYRFDDLTLALDMPDFLTFSPLISFSRGDFFDGTRSNVRAGFDWRPSVHFRTRLLYDLTKVDLPHGDFTARLVQAGADIVFSNALAWVNLVQYDNVSAVLGFSSRLHYTPRAGQDLFLALDHNLQETGSSWRSVASEAALKASYIFRF